MPLTAIIDIVCAVFIGVMFARTFTLRNLSKSSRTLNLCLMLMAASLLVDAGAYVIVGPSYPLALRYFLNLMAFTATCVNGLAFVYYLEALFAERGKVSIWYFRFMKAFEYAWLMCSVYEYIAGNLVSYGSDGIENVNMVYPGYIVAMSFAVIVIQTAVILINRRTVGKKLTILLAAFCVIPLVNSLLYSVIGIDLAYPLSAVALVFVAEFVQKSQLREQLSEAEKRELLAENASRFLALEDSFEVLYDVELDTGRYDIFVNKGRMFGDVSRSLLNTGSFFDDVEKNIGAVHPDDRQGNLEATRPEFIRRVLEGSDHYDRYYRLMVDGEPAWARMRIIYKDSGEQNVIIGVFNAREEMEAKERDAEMLRRKEQELAHSEFRASALAYLTEHEGDVTAFLDFFAGKLRELVGCDQVIYRDEKGNRYIKNAPELGDAYEIAAETCADCPHSDMHSPLYASGVTEMDDTAVGVDGVPVNRNCPVRSALTRTVSLDGVTVGYLAIHYILGRHEFSDYERRTLEEFGNLLSILLSRYYARKKNAQLERELGLKRQIEEQNRLLEEQQVKLAEALDMADAANRAKTDFLFNMSHDIRTPMNAIIGFTNIARKEIDNREKALDSLDKVRLSSEILLNLINDVLDMSRIESGKAELHEEKQDICRIFATIQPAMDTLAASKNIDLTFRIGGLRDRYVFTDGPRFDRVLINIVSNAIKYTPAGGTVRVEAVQAEGAKPGYGSYRFTVADNGIGMSEEFQKHMFEDFTREENSTTSGIQGTGLGLSLAKKLVDMMGGTISCVSRQGAGTTFTIVFPFRLQTEAEIAEGRDVETEQADINLTGKKALLVEDNEMNREIAEEILSDEGITVETASDGQKAVSKVLKRGRDYYDFILMDIQMPVMNGYEATETIRRLMPDLRAPIIALSANAFAEDRMKSINAGMDDHVAKPINIHELLGVLARHM